MAITIQVNDLPTDNLSFDDYYYSFTVVRAVDGTGGVQYLGTLKVTLRDTNGNIYKVASVTKEIGPAAKTALRDFLKAQFLPDLKLQESV